MGLHRQEPCLPLELCDAGHQMAASDDPHGCILDSLKTFNVGGAGVGKPDRGGESPEGLDDCLEGGNEGFFGVSPCGACQGLQDLKAFLSLGLDGVHVVAKGE